MRVSERKRGERGGFNSKVPNCEGRSALSLSIYLSLSLYLDPLPEGRFVPRREKYKRILRCIFWVDRSRGQMIRPTTWAHARSPSRRSWRVYPAPPTPSGFFSLSGARQAEGSKQAGSPPFISRTVSSCWREGREERGKGDGGRFLKGKVFFVMAGGGGVNWRWL